MLKGYLVAKDVRELIAPAYCLKVKLLGRIKQHQLLSPADFVVEILSVKV